MNVYAEDSLEVDRVPREDDEACFDIFDFFDDVEIEDSGTNSRFLEVSGYTSGLNPPQPHTLPILPDDTVSLAEVDVIRESTAHAMENSRERFNSVTSLILGGETLRVWAIGCMCDREEHAANMISESCTVGAAASVMLALAVPALRGHVLVYANWDVIPAEFVAGLYKLDGVYDTSYHGPIYIKEVNASTTSLVTQSCLFPECVTTGQWCRLRFPKSVGRRRLYDNEVALIVEGNQEYALVLLAPLIPWNMIDDDCVWKHRPFEYIKMLFERTQVYEEYSQSILINNTFESGLWLHRVPLRHICLIHRDLVTESEFMPFAYSAHTAVFAYFPQVSGWCFQEGEVVQYWWDSNTKGVIKTITDEGLTVNDDIEPEIEYHWGWAAKKDWDIGDEVACPDGYEGVVQSVKDGSVEVWDLKARDATNRVRSSRFYHANTLNTATGVRLGDDSNADSGRPRLCPWRFLPVRVTHGAAKGYHTVVDISRGNTASGYVVIVQSSVLNNRMIHTVDYSYVVCDKTGWPLHKVRSGKGWEFDFPLGYEHPHQRRPSVAPPWKRSAAVTRRPTNVGVESSSIDSRRTPPPSLQRHPSQLWLWELETCGLSFPVTVEMEERLWKVNLTVERIDEAFETKKMSFNRRGVVHVLHYLTEVETKPITKKVNRPFFVKSGEHKGLILARLKGSISTILSIRVNIFDGTIREPYEMRTVRIDDCCQINMDETNWKKLETALDILRLGYA